MVSARQLYGVVELRGDFGLALGGRGALEEILVRLAWFGAAWLIPFGVAFLSLGSMSSVIIAVPVFLRANY